MGTGKWAFSENGGRGFRSFCDIDLITLLQIARLKEPLPPPSFFFAHKIPHNHL